MKMPRTKKAKKEIESILKDELVDSVKKEHQDDDLLMCECQKAFFDKYTEVLYEVGKKYKFTYKRIKEIKAKSEKYLKVLD